MKIKLMPLILILITICCVGCSSDIVLPYSSEEYSSGEWKVDDLVEHFKELGFDEIEVLGDSETVENVYIENSDGKFESFDKGIEVSSSRIIWIDKGHKVTEPITVNNNSEFKEFVKNGNESDDDWESWQQFLKEHEGELLIFDGTITDWYDEAFWVGVSFSVAIENSEKLSFHQSTIDLLDLGLDGEYHYESYSKGLIHEGMRVNVTTEIIEEDGRYSIEYNSMQIIE